MIYRYENKELRYNLAGYTEGFPVFINYGLMGDIDLSGLHQLALDQKLKLVILERPGYGESDFIFMENYFEWNNMVEGFLDYIKIRDFAVLGISAGAPYSYAMASNFDDRLKGTYILNGLPFILDKEVFQRYKGNDGFYKKIWSYSQNQIQQEMYSVLKGYDNSYSEGRFKNIVEVCLSQNCSGVAQTVRLQMCDWGFDVYSLENKVYMWHSKEDNEIPFDAVRIMVNKMKNAQLEVKGKGHIPDREILSEVFGKIKSDLMLDII